MATISDVIDGTVTRDTNGLRHERVFIVQDLSGSGAAKLASALTAPGIPAENEAHPDLAGIREISTRCENIAGDSDRVRVITTYGTPELGQSGFDDSGTGQISFDSQMVTETVIEDINAVRMTTTYLVPPSTLRTITHQVDVERPLFTATARRRESTLDKAKILQYTGTVNSLLWNGFAAKTMLCRVAAVENDKQTYDYTYTFHYRAETWQADVKQLLDGRVPNDATPGNGIEVYDVYPLQDFTPLNLVI